MDYKLLLMSAGCAILGLGGVIINFRKGLKGYKDTTASPAQRRTDLLGGWVFCGASLLMMILGIAGLILTIKFAMEKRSPMSNMHEMIGGK